MATLLLDNDPDVYILLGGIGIGTNAPGSELEVVGDVQLSGNIIVGGTVDGVDVAAHAADGTVHFVEAAIDHGAIAGLGDDDHAQYILASGARSIAVLDVTGNITVGGTVDGRDIDGWLGQNISAAASPSFTGLTVTNTIVGRAQTAYYAD